MKKFYCAFMSLLMFASCSEEEMGGNMPDPKPELVRVSFQAMSGDDLSKSWYDYEEEGGGRFYHTWNVGDKVTVFADGINSATFTAKEAGRTTTIDGDLAEWNGGKNLYAVHPHRDDCYRYKSDKGFLFKAGDQVIDLASGENKLSDSEYNSFLIASAKDVHYTEDDNGGKDIDLSSLYFRQAMSYFKIDLVGLDGYTLKSVRIEDQDKQVSLIKDARIVIAEGGDNDGFIYDAKGYSQRLDANIINHTEGSDATIYFALFPTTLKNTRLEIRATDKEGVDSKFRMKLPEITFKRNEFRYYPNGLDLSVDFEQSKVKTISEVIANGIPSDGVLTLEITELDASTPGFDDLKKEIEGEWYLDIFATKVTLKFPDLQKVEGEMLFQWVRNLKAVEMPLVKEIGDQTFQDCRDLERVYMPALEKAGMWTFDDQRHENKVVEFIAATDPGIVLQFGLDGTEGGNTKCTNSRVKLTLGNKELYSGRENDNSITLYGKTKKGYGDIVHTFKSINWQ